MVPASLLPRMSSLLYPLFLYPQSQLAPASTRPGPHIVDTRTRGQREQEWAAQPSALNNIKRQIPTPLEKHKSKSLGIISSYLIHPNSFRQISFQTILSKPRSSAYSFLISSFLFTLKLSCQETDTIYLGLSFFVLRKEE